MTNLVDMPADYKEKTDYQRHCEDHYTVQKFPFLHNDSWMRNGKYDPAIIGYLSGDAQREVCPMLVALMYEVGENMIKSMLLELK